MNSLRQMRDTAGEWILDMYWRHWELIHGIDRNNPPDVDIEWLYEDDIDVEAQEARQAIRDKVDDIMSYSFSDVELSAHLDSEYAGDDRLFAYRYVGLDPDTDYGMEA